MKYRTATLRDAAAIAADLRPSDREELEAAGRTDMALAVMESIALSEESVVLEGDNGPVAVFGVARVSEEEGVPWLLGTTSLDRERGRLLTDARVVVHNMRKGYRVLSNYVYEGNTKSRRWLKWLGFDEDPPEAMGPLGKRFCRFHWESPDV